MDRESNFVVWYAGAGETYQQMAVATPVRLSASQSIAPQAGGPDDGESVVVQLVAPVDDAIAVALVPARLSRQVARNGIPLPSGLHPLRHGDRLVVGRQDYWFSAKTIVEEVAYDPEMHGQDVFCFLTKARLQSGQPIKICPGVPGRACGAIYKAQAWDLAMLSDTPMQCSSCGYSARLRQWEPPARKTKGNLDGLLTFISKR